MGHGVRQDEPIKAVAWLYNTLNIETDLKEPIDNPYEKGETVVFR